MKKIFLLTLLCIIAPQLLNAFECDFPAITEYEIYNVQKIKKITFKSGDYLVLFFHYDIEDPIIKDFYSEFNFENTIRLARKYWEEKNNLDYNDFWDKNGESIPYVLVEFGGTVSNDFFYALKGQAMVGTCYDRKNNELRNVRLATSSEYEQILNAIENVFLPVLALEKKEYQK